MALDLQRQLSSIPNAAAGTTSVLDLPRDSVMAGLDLILSFSGTQGATAATGTVSDARMLALIRRIEIVADGALTLWNLDAFSLYVLNALWYKGPGQRDAIGATFATGTFQSHLHIPFKTPHFEDENLTLLNAQALSSLQLKVTWGGISDVYQTVNNTTVDATTHVAVGTHEIVGIGPRSTFSALKVTQLQKDITAAGDSVEMDLPRSNIFKAALFKARGLTNGMEDVTDAIVNELRIESSELNRGLFVHRRLRGTDTNNTARNGYLLRNHARRVYSLYDFDAPQASGGPTQEVFTLTGFYPVEFMEDKRMSSGLTTQTYSTLKAIGNYSIAGVTSPRIDATCIEIIPAAEPR